MLTLSLNGNMIPVPEGFSMRLTIQSPVTNFEKIPFSYSLDFSLPINPHTSAALGHPERVAKVRLGASNRLSGFKVCFAGSTYLNGTLIVSVSGKTYNCTAVDLVGELAEKEQERSIREIPKFAEPITWENSNNYSPDTHPYCCFPIINQGFFKDRGVIARRTAKIPDRNDPEEFIDEQYDIEVLSYCFNKETMYRINAKNPDGTIKLKTSNIDITKLVEKYNTYSNSGLTVVTPFFFLKNIILEMLKSSGFHHNENILESSDYFKNLCIYNNFDITQMSFYTEAAQDGYWEQPPYTVGPDGKDIYDGEWKSAGSKIFEYQRKYTNNLTICKNHLPKMKVGEVLVSTQNLLNVCFDFLPNRQINVFSREDLLEMEAIDLEKYFLGEWFPGEKKNVALKFVREHDDSDEVFSERFTDLSDRIDDIKDPVADWTALLAVASPKEGDIRYMISTGAFFEFKMLQQSDSDPQTKERFEREVLGWEEISIGLQNGWYEYGREEVEEIKTGWSTCFGNSDHTLANQPGNQESFKSKKQDFKPRLLIYKGNNEGGTQTDNFSFEYGGNNGLLKTCWKRTAKWWANRLPMVGYFNFSENALRSIIHNKCLPYRTREASFMIEKIEVDLYIDHIGTAELTVYKR